LARAVIIRRAVLMEDEGREHLVRIVDSHEEAVEWIAKQKGEYFGPGDYRIMVEPDGT
jgi:hypothetical protein